MLWWLNLHRRLKSFQGKFSDGQVLWLYRFLWQLLGGFLACEAFSSILIPSSASCLCVFYLISLWLVRASWLRTVFFWLRMHSGIFFSELKGKDEKPEKLILFLFFLKNSKIQRKISSFLCPLESEKRGFLKKCFHFVPTFYSNLT